MGVTYVLKLTDFNNEYDLIGGASFSMMDGTLNFGVPSYDEASGDYGTRDISFSLVAIGSTREEAIENANALAAMVMRARHAYDAPMADGYGTGYGANDYYTGDAGVVLLVDVYESLTRTVNREDGGTGGKSYRINVRGGTVEFTRSPYQEGGVVQDGSVYKIYDINVRLECDPFFMTQPNVIKYGTDIANTGDDFYPRGNKKVMVVVSDTEVNGSAPAPTRIITREHYGGSGMIVSRCVGDNVWLAPSIPVGISGGGPYTTDFYPIGKLDPSTSDKDKVFRIKYTGTNTFQYSTNDGSTWSSTTVTVHQPFYFDASNNYGVVFLNDQLTSGLEYRFYPNQTQLKIDKTQSYASGDSQFYSHNGAVVAHAYVSVPSYARGKYIIAMYGYVAQGSTRQSVDWSAAVASSQIKESGASGSRDYYWTSWGATTFPWVYQHAGESIVLLGELDLGNVGGGFASYPNGHAIIDIAIYVRGLSDPGASVDVTVEDILLLSAQDEYSTMIAAWGTDFQGYEVYSSFDMKNPYVGELSATAFDAGSWGGAASPTLYASTVSLDSVIASGLDASMFGNPITIYPREKNYVLLIPVHQLSSDASWRLINGFRTGFTKEYYIAVRERHLFPGGK